jgi:hypothetical protein
MRTTNPVLLKCEQKTQQSVPAELQQSFQRIVAAGEKIMYSPQTRHLIMAKLQSGDPATVVGDGVGELFGILLKESKGTMNMKAAIPATTMLLCDALGLLEQAGKLQVTDAILAAATKEKNSTIMQLLKITPKTLQEMKARNQATGVAGAAAAPAGAPPGAPAGGLVNSAMGG